MAKYSGLLFYFESDYQANEYERFLENDWEYSDTISEAGFKVKDAEILLVSKYGDTIDYLVFAIKNRKVVSRKFKYTFKVNLKLPSSIKLDNIKRDLEIKFGPHFDKKVKGYTERLSVKTWDALIELIRNYFPSLHGDIDNLISELNNYGSQKRAGEQVQVLVHEKDAMLLSLKLSGFDHNVLKGWKAPIKPAPFLSGLPEANIGEDTMISHDQKLFGDWVRSDEYQVGSVSFTNNDEKITILNVNTKNLEHALGVDLVYYHHKYDTYLFIQYKRMRKDGAGKTYSYRPIDNNYKNEIGRIHRFEKWRMAQPELNSGKPLGYRFNNDIFYFKLCPETTFDPLSSDMISGMYLPLEYWDTLMESIDTLGPNGGRLICYDNVGRYFIHNAFLYLVQSGMIGSRVADSKTINELIRNSLKDGKSVFLSKVESLLKS